MKRFIISLLFVSLASAANAGPKTKISVMFKNFPQGTVCSADGTSGKVIRKTKKGHPVVDIKGNAEIGRIFCNLPNGKTVITDVNKRMPANTKTAGVTLYPDGQTYMTASAGGQLLQLQFANTLN